MVPSYLFLLLHKQFIGCFKNKLIIKVYTRRLLIFNRATVPLVSINPNVLYRQQVPKVLYKIHNVQ